jgi:hypothetical protein
LSASPPICKHAIRACPRRRRSAYTLSVTGDQHGGSPVTRRSKKDLFAFESSAFRSPAADLHTRARACARIQICPYVKPRNRSPSPSHSSVSFASAHLPLVSLFVSIQCIYPTPHPPPVPQKTVFSHSENGHGLQMTLPKSSARSRITSL